MRDLLPAEARRLAELGRAVSRAFELHGYERVTVPVFEYAEVLERGLGALDPREVLRFVEPETGEVVALRPDMTPQIARLVASRLAALPPPARLAYEGSIVRLRRERARRHRQIPQAGIELVGRAAPEGDLEVLTVACAATRAAGLDEFQLDLGHARVAGALLELAPPDALPELLEALQQKDGARLGTRARQLGLDTSAAAALAALPELCGGAEVFERAEALLRPTPAWPGVVELRAVAAGVAGLPARLSVDLGEVRHLAYYTGVTFQVLAEGPGQAIGAGGRYDGLFERFGAPRAAAGFALDLDNLAWAVGERAAVRRPRVLVAGPDADRVCGALRALGVPCAPAAQSEPREYARQWHYSHWVGPGPEITGVDDGRRVPLSVPEGDAAALATAIAQALSQQTDRSEERR